MTGSNNRTYLTGYYELKNPHKYLGTSKPYYKSSYECRMMYWCDVNSNVIEWNYEPFPIEYSFDVPIESPDWMKNLVDFQTHRYYIDFYAKILETNGNIQKYMIEIKPSNQTEMPKEPKRKTKKSLKKFFSAMQEYIKNSNKWAAAEEFCQKKGFKFLVLTEQNLF